MPVSLNTGNISLNKTHKKQKNLSPHGPCILAIEVTQEALEDESNSR